MKVSVYKGIEGGFSVLLEPSMGHRLHPVMLPDLTPEDWEEKVRTAITDMRRVSEAVRP